MPRDTYLVVEDELLYQFFFSFQIEIFEVIVHSKTNSNDFTGLVYPREQISLAVNSPMKVDLPIFESVQFLKWEVEGRAA